MSTRYDLARPYGARSCIQPDPLFPGETVPGAGGTWHTPRIRATGSNPWFVEKPAVLASILGPQPRAMLAAEIESKLRRAQRGQLVYGPRPHGDVEKMASVRDVLELRLGHQLDVSETKVHTRIYFHEPSRHRGQLWLLFIAAKADGPPGLAEQNQHASIAQSRLGTCTFEPLSVTP